MGLHIAWDGPRIYLELALAATCIWLLLRTFGRP